MRAFTLAAWAALVSLGCVAGPRSPVPLEPPAAAPPAGAPASPARLTPRPLGSTAAPMGFYEYLPPGYDDGAPRPLLVPVHGTYENGDGSTELFRLLANGPIMLASQDRWPASHPFVVLAPQHPGRLCTSPAELDGFLTWALANYRIDPRRVYLTGLSCGSIAVWNYLGDHGGEVVAAALLLAGDPGSPDRSWSAWGRRGCGLREVAIWAVHGTADSVVTITRERETMAKLAECPAPPGRELVWTERPGQGHDVWTAVYVDLSGEDPYGWLLSNPKP